MLDAGAVLALARGDSRARAAHERALREGYAAVLPTPVLVQVHRPGRDRVGRDRAGRDRVIKAIGAAIPTSVETAYRAGELLGRTGMTEAIDAIVAAEALRAVPSVVLTSDPEDLARLIEGEPGAPRVLIVGV